MAKKTALILMLLCLGCDSRSQVFHVYKKGDIFPEVVAGKGLDVQSAVFCSLFEEVTGYRPAIKGEESPDAHAVVVLSVSKNNIKESFIIKNKDNKVIIEGETVESLERGIRYFFSTYTGYIMPGVYKRGIEAIDIPIGLTYEWETSFEYREPYFRNNFKPKFREWNNTQTLEETWALWGHNIAKVITPSAAMMAQADGKENDEQFCFSSPELESALSEYIRSKSGEAAKKFMIMPNDNDLVCVCDRCKKLGNTKDNASPAVFTLLNKLAIKFPKQEFFSTAYITTQAPPPFSTASNTGVMISTMGFPKAIILEESGKKELVVRTFDSWKKVTDRIYLWDYAVNYDNYFEAYPTVSIAQQNLKYYKKLGVTGVFMHGSEERFSAFDDLKCYLYAQLLRDVNINLKEYTEHFFLLRYPVTGKLLSDYYNELEQTAFDSPRQLDIYGGIGQAKKKYLNEAKLTEFYDILSAKAKTMTGDELAALKPILASLVFIKLELLRTKESEGYNDPEAKELTDKLRLLSIASEIRLYNESDYTVSGYLDQWNSEILKQPYKNILFGKTVKFAAEPDEDYNDAKMLTDGLVGFNDYYNNWLLSTTNMFSVEINADDVRGAKVIEMSFLNDNRHRIYLPKKIVIIIGDRRYEKEIPMLNAKAVSKYKVSIPVEILPQDKVIVLQAIKQDDYVKKSTACDELFFK